MPLWVFLPLSLVCASIVLYRYYTIDRLAAGIGWAILILAIGGFGSGLAGAFAWSGFAFLFLAAAGLLIIVQDALVRRQARRTRPHSASQRH